MKTKSFKRPGKSKSDLLKCLENVKKKYASQIDDNNISIKRKGDTFNVNVVKKTFFKKFWVDADLTLEDGRITLEYETNIPTRKEKDFIKMIEKEINSACN